MASKSKKTPASLSSAAGPSTRASPKKNVTPPPEAEPESTGSKKTSLSPTKFSRLHEKEELANLNDRLACYIDRVRNLEGENSRLTREVKTSQENVTREVTSVKTMYEGELTEARKLLDELSREKAKLQIDTRRLYTENEELRNDYDKKVKELSAVQGNLTAAETRIAELNAKVNQLQADKKKLADDYKQLETEKNRLTTQLTDTRKHLEEETLQRVDMENALQTLKEEYTFKEQLYEQQLHESRTRRQVEISELDGRLTQEYEEKLYLSLQEIREQYETDLENNKEEFKRLYEEKIRSLSSQITRSGNAANMAMSEVKAMQVKVDELNTKILSLEAEKNAAVGRARDLEKSLELAKTKYMDEYNLQDKEISKLREEMASQAQEYQDLMDIKVALDMEIAAYRKLLEGEEARLNITPVSSPGAGSTPRKVLKGKRKRTVIEETEETNISNYLVQSSSKCEIAIDEVCAQGKFVRLINKSAKEFSLGGWQVIRKVGEERASYKFHRLLKIDGGATVTIWSADLTDRNHEPPANLVMKGQKWLVGDVMLTTLVNPDMEMMAIAEHKKQKASDKSSLRQSEGTSLHSAKRFMSSSIHKETTSTSTSSLPPATVQARAEERCAIM